MTTWPGENLLIKMWESIVDKGIGSLLAPWQRRREGLAQIEIRRHEVLALTQMEHNANEIRAGAKRLAVDENLVYPPEGQSIVETSQIIEGKALVTALMQSASNNLVADQVRREINVTKAVLHAEEQLQNDTQNPTDRRIDDDWLYRWREHASEVSNGELQKLWGRVLAGEVKSPGSFALRTLDFFRNLTQEEATSISRLSQFALAGEAICRVSDALMESLGLSFGFILEMRDLGVLVPSDAQVIWNSLVSDKFHRGLVSHDRVLICEHAEPQKTIKLACYRLSSIGREIQKLGVFASNEQYLRKVGELICEQGFTVKIARFEPTHAGGGRFFDAQDIK